jgi:molybdenum cofactor guanylyltransferase
VSGDGGSSTARYDILILAGGAARRLGGRDKPGLIVGGRSLLESVVHAGRGARRVIVAGPERAGLGGVVSGGVVFVREEPPGAGPVPAVRRGLAEVESPWVGVLAADLPFLRDTHVTALLGAAVGNGTGAVLADDGGRPQWLAGCWRTAALREGLAGYGGDSLRGLLAPLRPELVRVPGEPPPWLDCDTPGDLERALAVAAASFGDDVVG